MSGDPVGGVRIHRNEDYLRLEVERIKSLVNLRLRAVEGVDVSADLAVLRQLRRTLGRARQQAFDDGVSLPLENLARRFALDEIEIEILLVVVAPLLDGALLPLYKRLRGGFLLDTLDISLAIEVACDDWDEKVAGRRALAYDARLASNGLLVVKQARGSTNVLHQELVLPPPLLHHLLGDTTLAETLVPYCEVCRESIDLDAVILPKRIRDDVLAVLGPGQDFLRRLTDWGYDGFLPYGRGITVLMTGAPGTGKTVFATALAMHLGRPLLRIRSDKLQESDGAVEQVLADLRVEAAVRNAIVFFDDCEGLFSERGARLSTLLGFVERFEGVLIMATNRPARLDSAVERRIVYRVELPMPDPELRGQLWEMFLPPGLPMSEDVDILSLANLYEFAGGTIKNAVMVALNRALSIDPKAPLVTMPMLVEAANAQLRVSMEECALEAKARLTLEDVILPEEQSAQVQEILDACLNHAFVMNRWEFATRLSTGKGLIALFDGPPGTGKTLCAEVLANEVERPLFRVNIPAVVSKWVGETEKHIQDMFARARASHAMLLFDEADALFSRRVAETASATDRYANMEVNLLLQEVERFDGVVILTTNLVGGLDDALKRRIMFRVTFPHPDAAHRTRIWRTLIPRRAPLASDVDFDFLGRRFDIAGGHIKNAVLRAAYMAANSGGPIRQEHLVEAATSECKAAGVLYRMPVPPLAPPEHSRDSVDG